jgi:hypothetical protein
MRCKICKSIQGHTPEYHRINVQIASRLYYGWWVTGACFFLVGAHRGSETAYGVLLMTLVRECGWERATIIGALALLVAGFVCCPAGMVLCRSSFRPIFSG